MGFREQPMWWLGFVMGVGVSALLPHSWHWLLILLCLWAIIDVAHAMRKPKGNND